MYSLLYDHSIHIDYPHSQARIPVRGCDTEPTYMQENQYTSLTSSAPISQTFRIFLNAKRMAASSLRITSHSEPSKSSFLFHLCKTWGGKESLFLFYSFSNLLNSIVICFFFFYNFSDVYIVTSTLKDGNSTLKVICLSSLIGFTGFSRVGMCLGMLRTMGFLSCSTSSSSSSSFLVCWFNLWEVISRLMPLLLLFFLMFIG